ncbi:MAG: hypothetical protein JXM74_08410 [Fusobacteriaceae bacterium]|nr:hypothetical protein [Fusobacteriaceae bacterium]MBN2838759.1 hypothetical protein [Fusobacteriaceae bacterium]
MKRIDYTKLLYIYGEYREKAYKELNVNERKEFFNFLDTKYIEIKENNKLIEEKFRELKN